MFFNQAKQDGMQIFKGILFFKSTDITKMNVSLACCRLDASLFVFVLFVALKKRIPWKICILSCFVSPKDGLFNLSCVFVTVVNCVFAIYLLVYHQVTVIV